MQMGKMRKEQRFYRTLLTISLIVGLVCIGYYYFIHTISTKHLELSEKQKLDQMRQLVQIARNSIEPIIIDYHEGIHSKQESIEAIRGVVRRMIFTEEDGLNYIFMSSYEGNMLVQPFHPEMEMNNNLDLQDPNGKYIIRELIKTAKESPHGGFVSYYFYPPGKNVVEEKISFVMGIEELECYIGTGYYMGSLRLEQARFRRGIIIVQIGGILLLMVLLLSIGMEIWKQNQALLCEVEMRKASEAALKKNKENLAITLHSIGDGVIATDCNGCIMQMNPVAEKLTGWSIQDAKGKSLTDVFHIVHMWNRKPVENPVDKVLKTGVIVGLESHTALISRSGDEYQIADSGAPIRSVSGEIVGVVLVFRDVSKEYAMQEKLKQSEKMQAIGQLAGGVAHDFNNMLAGVMGVADLMKAEPDMSPENIDYLDMIIDTTTRASNLTSKLLAFSRRGKMLVGPIDVHKLINDTEVILNRTIDKKNRVSISLNAGNYIINGDASGLQNILMNIAINASHSMADGGVIEIDTQNVFLDKVYCESSSFVLKPGTFLQLEVRDTGCGIPFDNLAKIFEPFYTTKSQGQGTGLGLAAVYGTVQDHGGAVNVYSEVGVGTSFHVLLPCSSDTVSEEKRPVISLKSGSGKVLLVDDEKLIRITCEKMLHRMGYDVLIAENGKKAVELFAEHKENIDLVLMDMIMPVMNGAEAFYLMRESKPDCKVIISSGFAHHEKIQQLQREGIAGFIRKPYRMHDLNELINTIL